MNQIKKINHFKKCLKKQIKKEEEYNEDLKEGFSLNNKSSRDWYDKNKFNKILTTIDSNNFIH